MLISEVCWLGHHPFGHIWTIYFCFDYFILSTVHRKVVGAQQCSTLPNVPPKSKDKVKNINMFIFLSILYLAFQQAVSLSFAYFQIKYENTLFPPLRHYRCKLLHNESTTFPQINLTVSKQQAVKRIQRHILSQRDSNSLDCPQTQPQPSQCHPQHIPGHRTD